MFFDDGDEERGTFGPPAGGSKLSSLFGMDRANNQGGNESLTYTAPKQPKKTKGGSAQEPANPSTAGGQSALLLAVAVHAYRFSNGTYIKHGKLGAAILGNHVANDYKILLYISKQQQVTHARISPSFIFTVQANNYATFYDEQRQNWSVMFESEQNAVDFAKQVGLAKLNASGGATKGVMGQDLVIGIGDPIQTGDSIEVKYTGWLYQNKSFGNIFDSNVGVEKAFRFKIGKGKVIKGWEEGVLGMKKSGRRLLLIPPAKGYGKKGLSSRIPPNSTLIFDVEIKKVKVGKEREDGGVSSDAVESSRSDIETREQPPPPRAELRRDNSKSDPPPPPHHVETEDDLLPSMDNLHEERSFDDSSSTSSKPSGNVSDQMTSSPSTSKAKLISRMAKMGQPMLPMSGAAVAQDSTDSENEENSASSDAGRSSPSPTTTLPRKPMKVPRKPAATPAPAQQNILPASDHMAAQNTTFLTATNNTLFAVGSGQQQHQVAVYQAAPMSGQQPMNMQQPQQYPGYPQQQIYPQQGGNTNQQMVPQQDMYGNAVYPSGVSQPMMQPSLHSHVPMLLSEARQHHTNLQDSVSKVSDKIETLNLKVDKLNINSSNQLNLAHSATSMEAGILMTNIERIVKENDKLKKELADKSTKIETQNEKISELLQRNQMYVEQSNSLLEKRNDSFKQTTAQSQTRVLELEQEKVQLSTELSSTTAQMSSLQLEVSGLQQKENQLKVQLAAALSQAQERLSELDCVKDEFKDSDTKANELVKQLKDERLEKKALNNRLQGIEEELSDAQSERDTLEKAVVDRKRKSAAEKQRAEEEMEELKKMYEDELNVLKNKLKQQKSNVDMATAEQVTQVERELEAQWKERSERQLAQAQDKHDGAYNEVMEEKEALRQKLANTEQKMMQLRSSQGDSKEEAEKLKEQIDEMAVWKEKYENLHSGAVGMKERYEGRIKELMQEKADNAAKSPQSNVIDEVKKIMNNVYHTLRNEFDAGSNYKGSEILNIIMNTIKAVTMKLMTHSLGEEASEEEDEESEEDESEEESEEEEEEEEEEESDEEDEDEDEEVEEQQSVSKVSSEPAITQQAANVTEATLVTSAPTLNEDITDNTQQHHEHEVEAVKEVETVSSEEEESDQESDFQSAESENESFEAVKIQQQTAVIAETIQADSASTTNAEITQTVDTKDGNQEVEEVTSQEADNVDSDAQALDNNSSNEVNTQQQTAVITETIQADSATTTNAEIIQSKDVKDNVHVQQEREEETVQAPGQDVESVSEELSDNKSTESDYKIAEAVDTNQSAVNTIKIQTDSASTTNVEVTQATDDNTHLQQKKEEETDEEADDVSSDVKEDASEQEEQESDPEDSREDSHEHSISDPSPSEPPASQPSPSEPPVVEDPQSSPVGATGLPPDLPEVDQQEGASTQDNVEDQEEEVEVQDNEAAIDGQSDVDKDITTTSAIDTTIPDGVETTEDDLPDFSSPTEETAASGEVEDSEGPPPLNEPPPFVPDLPPDLPPELPPELPEVDDEKPKRKNTGMDDIFGSDDDDDFFTTPSPTKKKEKKVEKKPEPSKSAATPNLNNNEEDDDLRPKPPPPLFGDDDDDDDDLDWLN